MATKIETTAKPPKLVVGAQAPNITNGKQAGTLLSNANASLFNVDVKTVRQTYGELAAVRLLARVDGDVSASVSAMVRIANSGISYRVYDAMHQLVPEGSDLLRAVIDRMQYPTDYTLGFDDRPSFAGLTETLLRSVVVTGAVAAELVLDKQRLPYAIRPTNVEKIKFVTSKQAEGVNMKVIPRLTGMSGNIDLDIPTFFMSFLDADPASAYSYSPLESALNTSIFHAEVVNDIRRVVSKSGHSRLLVQLNHEELVKASPLEVRSDSNKLAEWLEGIRQSVVKEIEGLAPESAIVTFNNVEAAYLNSEIGAASDYTGLIGIINALLATSLKTPLSVLGKDSGNQNSSSVESLLYIKTAAGLHQPVETLLSRALTLSVRLLGFDGTVEAKFNPIVLRPEIELESFKMMEQQRVLEQLSYGFITDVEAAAILQTGPLSPDFEPLSGTKFLTNKADVMATNTDANPATRDASPMQGGKPPKSSGGKDNAKRA